MAFDNYFKLELDAKNINEGLLHEMIESLIKESKNELLKSIKADLGTIFIVSEFVLSDVEIQGETFESGVISVTAREGVICDRCWKVVDEVSEDGLCERCAEIIRLTLQ